MSVDRSFERLVSGWPSGLRAEALRLPVTLGLAGGRWEGFAQLRPVVDLPGCAGVAAPLLEQARFAHHCGGFWGLTCDRLSDGQARAAVSKALVEQLKRCWFEACTTLGASLSTLEGAVHSSHLAWGSESGRRRRPRRSVSEYLATSVRKIAWFPLATGACLSRGGTGESVRGFLEGAFLMMLALQLVDDALDGREDRALFGHSTSEQLGMPAAEMLALATRLSSRSASAFSESGFATLASWNRMRGTEIQARFAALPPPPPPPP